MISFLLQTESFDLEELFGQLIRFGIIALFFIGPLLKSIFDKKEEAKKKRKVRRVPTPHQPAPEPFPTPADAFPEPEFEEPEPIRAQTVRRKRQSEASIAESHLPSLGSRIEGLAPEASQPRGLGLGLERERDTRKKPRPRTDRSRRLHAWRSAIVAQEVLGRPVSLQPPRDEQFVMGGGGAG